MAELSDYPERRFFLMLEGGKELNGGMTEHLATPVPDGYVLLEALPKAHVDALRQLARAVAKLDVDGVNHDADCGRFSSEDAECGCYLHDAMEAIDGLSPAFLATLPKDS